MILAVSLIPFTAFATDTTEESSMGTEVTETEEKQDLEDMTNEGDGEESPDSSISEGDDTDTEDSSFDREETDLEESISDENKGNESEGENLDSETADSEEDALESLADNSYITYAGHAQTRGDLDAVSDGAELGTTGQSKRLEAFQIQKGSALEKMDGDIIYRVHAQTYGTMDWKKNGKIAGTRGEAKRVEALQMYLTGELAEKYDVYYSVHVQRYGWTKWTKGSQEDSGWCGTAGLALRLEAIKIQLVEKDGGTVPQDGGELSYITQNNLGSVTYFGHQQTYGDLQTVSDGTILGVTGQSKRLEALTLSLQTGTEITGSVRYRSHVQGIGWMEWVDNGVLSGTMGQSKRMEAIQIELTGDIAKYCDVWYRVHVQRHGWLDWAKNGQMAGTTGLKYRMEAIQIKVLPKVANAPGPNNRYYIDTTPQQERVNSGLQNVYNQTGWNLYNCFMWCVNNIRYSSLGDDVPAGYTTTQWFALYGLEQNRGDCRTYAATFYQLAKGLGYKARYVYGYVPSAGGGLIDHAWVEIDMDGTTYVFDTDFQYETGRNGYQITYGTSGTWRYTDYFYMD